LASEIAHLIPASESPLGSSTGSEMSSQQAREWIRTCAEQHDFCKGLISQRSQQKFRPKRLLELDAAWDSVYLREDDYFDAAAAVVTYTTVSHCWGAELPRRLTTENTAQFSASGIALADLSRTHQEAVKASLDLGIRFIWIDSLCIQQNSDNDWLEQSSQMHQIYSNSYCNIAATASVNGSGGCFRSRNVLSLRPVEFTFDFPAEGNEPRRDGSFYLADAGVWWNRFERQPLHRRAWVLQERLLAPRVLHFDMDQIAWECSELVANERFPLGVGLLLENRRWMPRFSIDPEMYTKLEANAPGQALSQIWQPVVRNYTSLHITKWSDRLIALAGVAETIKASLGWDYVAGLFTINIQTQLLWQVIRKGDLTRLHDPTQLERRPTRPSPTVAPSWSWLSLDAPVDLMPHWQKVMTSESESYTKDSIEYFAAPKKTRAHTHTGEPRLSPEELETEYLCDVTGIQRGDSAEERSGLSSTARLQVSCYLVPLSLPDAQKEADGLRKALANGEWGTYSREFKCVAYPPGLSQGKTTEAEDADTPRQQQADYDQHPNSSFHATLTWDIVDECNLGEGGPQLFLMPVIHATQFAEQHWTDVDTRRDAYGLLLTREVGKENEADNVSNRFRRCGHFKTDGYKFWRAATKCEMIQGVELLTRDNVACPVIPEKETRTSLRTEKRDGIKQYQIELV
jgi:hypothetical protein